MRTDRRLTRVRTTGLALLMAGGLSYGCPDTIHGWQGPAGVRNHQPEEPAHRQSVEHPIFSHLRLTAADVTAGLTAERLLLDFANQHTAGNYRGAVLLARDLIARIPNHPEGYYNLACSQARLRHTDAALDALSDAIDRGWRHLEHTRIDPDLESLHGHDRFAMLLDRMSQLRQSERIEPGPLRTDPIETVAADVSAAAADLLARYNLPGMSVAVIDRRQVAWTGSFGRRTTEPSAAALDPSDRVVLHRPIELLALLAAAQQQQVGHLDLGRLLAQADQIGLRSSTGDRASRLADGRRSTTPSRGVLVHGISQHDVGFQSTDPSRVDWTGRSMIPGTLDLVILGVELTADREFTGYCNEAILTPSSMARSQFRSPRPHSTTHGSGDASVGRDGVVDAGAANRGDAPAMVLGHTRFGTPITPADRPSRLALETDVADLARLLAGAMTLTGHEAGSGVSLTDVIRSGRSAPSGLGLAVDLRHSSSGPRCQMAELVDGYGFLARWYPQTGRGVVIVFNGETGPDVAARIAQLVLGGR